MKIFLTGGTGYIGGNFINHALKQKHTIYAVSRKKVNKKKKKFNLVKRSNRKKLEGVKEQRCTNSPSL